MNKVTLISQNSMASYVFTMIFVNKHHDKISSIFIIDLISGESISSKIKNLRRLIKNSSIQFAFYKFFETQFYMFVLKLFKFLKKIQYSKIEDIAKSNNLPVYKFKDINDPEFIKQINSTNDCNFSIFTTGQILKKSTLDNLKSYPINCHGSYLPKFRGAAQYIWYHVYTYKEFGITFHNLTHEIDAGDILYQKNFQIPENISCFYLHYLIAKNWGLEFDLFINDLNFPPNTETQDHSQSSNLSLPNSEAFKKLKLQNKKIIKISDLKKISYDLKQFQDN